MIDILAFDGDDTLWHNEPLYIAAQEKLKALLVNYISGEVIERQLYDTEVKNIHLYGYGIKSFTLSMIETGIILSEGKINASEILEIISYAKDMLTSEVQLLDHVNESVRELAQSHDLMIVTKGDLRDQHYKLDKSQIGKFFRYVEVVTEKNQDTYAHIFAKYGVHPHKFLMVGNSIKSDIVPVIELGGLAVHIPYQMTWVHETMEHTHHRNNNYFQIEHMGKLPPLIKHLTSNATP